MIYNVYAFIHTKLYVTKAFLCVIKPQKVNYCIFRKKHYNEKINNALAHPCTASFQADLPLRMSQDLLHQKTRGRSVPIHVAILTHMPRPIITNKFHKLKNFDSHQQSVACGPIWPSNWHTSRCYFLMHQDLIHKKT